MFSSLNKNGQAAIICSQGVLFRGGEEEEIRKNMITEDIIEGVIAIPPKLFYGTGIPGCVLILNRNKPANRRKKIIFVYAARDMKERFEINLENQIQKIVSAFRSYRDIDLYCHIAGIEDLQENAFNLNVPRYVDISEAEEEIDIQEVIDSLKSLDCERQELYNQVRLSLKELGFQV